MWTAAGLDRTYGGSVEVLDFDGEDGAAPFKRVRAQARQVYAFSHAALLGWDGPAREAADHVWSFLKAKARREDGAWVRLLARDGSVLDATCDAYDMAFILFALAWRHRAGDGAALAEAHATLDALERILGLGGGAGFRAAEDKPDARLQNPHMHLLEASVELALATRDQRFADMARDVSVLFRDRLFDEKRGALFENFDADWRPLGGEAEVIEPGHLHEWCWLLHRAEPATGLNLRDQARALTDFAERHGIDAETRLTFDALDGDGLTPRRTFRSWPQTEALKAHLALFEHGDAGSMGRIAETTDHLLNGYLDIRPRGGWMDKFGPGWAPLSKDIPSSILYHVQIAFTELLRLRARLERESLT